MRKYYVKFSHIIQSPINNQTNIPTQVIEVDDTYEVENHVDIFTLIRSRFNVVGSITAIALSDD